MNEVPTVRLVRLVLTIALKAGQDPSDVADEVFTTLQDDYDVTGEATVLAVEVARA